MADARTALYDWHVKRKARMVSFGGWQMPVQYTSIVEEHLAVRRRCGWFDISHMGRLSFRGEFALPFLEAVCTNAVGTLKPLQIRYSLLCQADGGVLDDVLVYRWPDHYGMVVNASNRLKVLGHFDTVAKSIPVERLDQTESTVMIALQGPEAIAIGQTLFDFDPGTLKNYYGQPGRYQGTDCLISRTGYTGEDGLEVILPGDLAVTLAEALCERGVVPCGLGARDTLRLEAAMPLYGHELNETIDPLTAGLGWAVKLNKGDFIGQSALAARPHPPARSRIGLRLEGKRAAREGCAILHDGATVGQITSGSYTPHLEASIAMGYVPTALATPGTPLSIDIRGTLTPATVVPLPFYQRA